MNLRRAYILVAIVAGVSFAQTPPKKASSVQTKPDTWQRSKECAAQAEKAVAAWSQRTGSTPADWSNHFSQKHDRCFVSISSLQASKDEKTYPTVFTTALFDAFERGPSLASYCSILGHEDCVERLAKIESHALLDSVCRELNGKSFADANASEQEAAQKIADKIQREQPPRKFSMCAVDGKPTDCVKAEAFIAEHMKN
jgi:hypothetical protein